MTNRRERRAQRRTRDAPGGSGTRTQTRYRILVLIAVVGLILLAVASAGAREPEPRADVVPLAYAGWCVPAPPDSAFRTAADIASARSTDDTSAMTPHRRSVLLVGVVAALAIAIPVMGADPSPSAGPSASSGRLAVNVARRLVLSRAVRFGGTVGRVGAAQRDTGDGDRPETGQDTRSGG